MALEVTLISHTEKPAEVLYWALRNQHFNVPNDLKQIALTATEKKEFIDMLGKQFHTSVFEYVETIWLIKGASRSFQQQLTRTRNATYSIQSLRIVDVGNFAQQENYHIPEKIKTDNAQMQLYKSTMLSCELAYRKLIDNGANPEDARGILPLNICSSITMKIDFRNLMHMLENRLCFLAQGEFQEIARQMKKEIKEKMGDEFANLLIQPCIRLGCCPMIIHCGKMDCPQKNSVDVGRWIKDKTKIDKQGKVVKGW